MEFVFAREPTQEELAREQERSLRRQHRVAERGEYAKQKEIRALRQSAKNALRSGQQSVAYDALDRMLLKEGVRQQYAQTSRAVEGMQAVTEQVKAGRAMVEAQMVTREIMGDMNEYMENAQEDGLGNWQAEQQQFSANMQRIYGAVVAPYADAAGAQGQGNPNDALIRQIIGELSEELQLERGARMGTIPRGAVDAVASEPPQRSATPLPLSMPAVATAPPCGAGVADDDDDDDDDEFGRQLKERLRRLK